MKLQAVTICINYADYLECIVANRRHFDRWVVVTVPGDGATAAVCARHGIEVVLSRTLKADGRDFNAANNKSRALNEGLDALDPEGWAVILDSDVLLPRHFRERVEALPLEKGCLYAVAGRKVCEDREMFEMLRPCEPWDRFCDRSSQALGYFNLFHLEHPVNRYVERDEHSDWPHDDWRFTTSFPEEDRRQIPMTVIHTGPPGTNWAGRVARSFHAEGAGDAAGGLPVEIAGTGSVAVIGYFPGSRWREMAGRFGKALLVDQFQVHHPSGSPMVEADRAALRGLWAEEAAECGNVELLGTHSAGTLARIADGSLDALYLPGEVTPGWLAAALPHWLAKLKDGALLCGDLYGLPHWPDATYAIALLMGTPLEVAANGFWRGRKRAGLVRVPEERTRGEREVIFAGNGMEDIERLLVTMHRVRKSWAGRMRLFHWGAENQALRIAAARPGVEMTEVGEAPGGGDGVAAETLAAGLWRDALYLPAGGLVFGRVDEMFSGAVEAAGFDAAKLWRLGGASGDGRVPACHARDFEETAMTPPTALLCTGPAEEWTDAAWALWSEALTAMTAELAAEIRVAADATVVVLLGTEAIHEFEHAWLSLKFAPAVPVVVGLAGMAVEDVWLAPTGAGPEIVALSAAESARQQMAVLLGRVRTERVILLPATAAALPGAELFPHEAADGDIMDVTSGWPGGANGREMDSAVFGIFRTATLLRFCTERAADPVCAGPTISPPTRQVDMERKGWRWRRPPAPAASDAQHLAPAASPL